MVKGIMKLLRNLAKPIGVSIIIGAIFGIYMIAIGIPKTRAYAYYEIAIQQEGLGAIRKADEYFKKAIESFPEPYILAEYERFKDDN